MAKKRSQRERLCEALVKRGYKSEGPTTGGRYVKFLRGAHPKGLAYWYVGRSGALRTGHTVTDSILALKTRAELLAEVPD